MDSAALAATLRSRGRDALVARFGVDARALAAFRVALGGLLLADLLLRARDLTAHYTDFGVLPRAALSPSAGLHVLSGTAWAQAAVFAVAAGFAAALAVGYRTRLATALSLVMVVSLHLRNPLVLNGGDLLLRHLLFWALFVPLGRRWSVDSLRADGDGDGDGDGGRQRSESDARGDRVASLATAALLAQVVVIYTANAAFKLRGDLWPSGEAIRYVFSLGQFTVLLGDVLAEYPRLLVAFDRVWLTLVTCSVLLVVLTGWARAAFAALFVGMHAGMALTMQLGLFPFVSIAALVPFFPPAVWDAATARAPSLGSMVGASALSERVRTRLADGDRERSAFRDALGRWGRRLSPPVVAVLLAVMVVWNAATLGYVAVPDEVRSAVDPDEHRWDMFAPEPVQTDGWYVVPGQLESGGTVDALHRTAVRWDRPPDVSDTYPNARWRKYLRNLLGSDAETPRRHFAAYLCRRWNDDRSDDLTEVTVYHVAQPTRLDGPEPTRREKLVSRSCSPDGA